MADKNRPLHILKYLWDHTDEEHPAIITDILAHLESCIEMQPKKCMQPTDKLEFVDYIGVPTSIKLPG